VDAAPNRATKPSPSGAARYRHAVGYFKRKLDRKRSRDLVRQIRRDVPWDPDALTAWSVVPPKPPPKHSFLRFACAERHPVSGRRTGIFAAAYQLLDGTDLDSISETALRACVSWFEEHLPVPKTVHNEAAVFLFRSHAGQCTRRIWELVRLLCEQGIVCEMQVLRDPGTIVYQDAYQVAVVPRSGPSKL
jgi:hypothetical protein